MKKRFSFIAVIMLLAAVTGSSAVGAQNPSTGATTFPFGEFGIMISFPNGWNKSGVTQVAGSDYFVFSKSFRGDNGPEVIRFSAAVHRAGTAAQGINKTSRHYFPVATHTIEMDEETATFNTLALSGITQGGTMFSKSSPVDDEGIAHVFYAFSACNRVITAVVPSEIPMEAEAELNFILQSLRCAE